MGGRLSRRNRDGCSVRAAKLLSREEGYDAEFKESVSSLKNEALVAFANSEHGGAILIGAAEVDAGGGKKKGKVIGCTVSSEQKLAITTQLRNFVEEVNQDLHIRLEEIAGSASEALDMASEASGFGDETLGEVRQISEIIQGVDGDLAVLHKKTTSLLDHFGIEDPMLTERKRFAVNILRRLKTKMPRATVTRMRRELSGYFTLPSHDIEFLLVESRKVLAEERKPRGRSKR